MRRYYAGVDLGATNVRAAVATEHGRFLGTADDRTPTGPTGIAVTEAVLDVLREACSSAGVDPADLRSVGIGSIGPLDLAAGTVEGASNLPDDIGTVPLVGPVRELVDTDRVTLQNDTTAGVVGERFFSERSPDDVVYLTISSGIGAGVVVDGSVLSGWDGNAGEIGHVVVDPSGRRTCGCGHDGHWEAYCSGENLPGYARDLADDLDVGTDLPVDDSAFSAVDVFEAADDDPLAAEVVDRVARWNAIGVANVVHAYAPMVVSVGGAVALNNEAAVVEPIRERLSDLVVGNVPELRLTPLGDEVVVRGAVAMAIGGADPA